jgi:hypothetical protein
MDKIVGFAGIHCPPAGAETAASLIRRTGADTMNAKTHSADIADVADLAELADRYVALWNETDAGARRAAIATLWVPEGEHFVRTLQVKGYEALEQRVIGSHEKNVRYGGFRFRATGDAQLLQNAVMFHWEMVPAAGGPVAALGLEFLLLAGDGRIAVDYQFILPTPSA